MTVALVAAFGVVAVINWGAGQRRDRRLEAITKVLATAILAAVAASAGDMSVGARTVLVVAVVLCLVGDVALLGDSDERFVAGLGSFAAGHLVYVVTALLVGVSWPRALLAVPFLAVLFAFRFVSRIIPGARRHGGGALAGAVVFYAAVISAMVVTATGTPCWSAAAGAMVFAVSDWILGYNRFVQPIRRAQLAVMASYHVGQLLLILGLVAGA